MTTYTAIFADGDTVTRKSDREYNFAWRTRFCPKNNPADVRTRTGFARDRLSAGKAARVVRWKDLDYFQYLETEIVTAVPGSPKT